MKYAIFSYNGNQYKVSEGQEILIEGSVSGKKMEFDNVLLVADGDKVLLGNPQVKGARVVGEIVEEVKGDKVRVLKYKAKSRYRRVRGHRSRYTRVRISKISTTK